MIETGIYLDINGEKTLYKDESKSKKVTAKLRGQYYSPRHLDRLFFVSNIGWIDASDVDKFSFIRRPHDMGIAYNDLKKSGLQSNNNFDSLHNECFCQECS